MGMAHCVGNSLTGRRDYVAADRLQPRVRAWPRLRRVLRSMSVHLVAHLWLAMLRGSVRVPIPRGLRRGLRPTARID